MNIIFPWSYRTAELPYPKSDLQIITENLYKLYPTQYRNLTIKSPGKRIENITTLVVSLLAKMQSEGEMPWMLLSINSSGMAQTLSSVIPMTWAFTTGKSAASSTTAQLMDFFVGKLRNKSLLAEEDPVDTCKRSNMFFWCRVDAVQAGSEKMAGKFTDLVSFRNDLMSPTIFTVCHNKFGDGEVKQLFSLLDTKFGRSFGTLLKENCYIQSFKAKVEIGKINTTTIE